MVQGLAVIDPCICSLDRHDRQLEVYAVTALAVGAWPKLPCRDIATLHPIIEIHQWIPRYQLTMLPKGAWSLQQLPMISI